MTARRRPSAARLAAAIGLAMLAVAPPSVGAQSLPTPERFFGYRMGTDRKLARWDRIVEYFNALQRGSDRIRVVNMGPTEMGNPFLALYISSPANLARLEEYRQVNLRLSDPRGLSEAEARRLASQGKAVIVQSMGLHSTEVASAQMATEFVHDLLTRTDPDAQRILDNVITIVIPCFNPDGEIIVTDWYDQTVGTPAEGLGPPVLYAKYVGHDNNRDAFMTNMVESRYAAQILFRDWKPEAYLDHHQMGSYGARIYVPPYAEPIRPAADPLVWREMSWYGAHIAYKEEEAGLAGVINMAIYSGWGHMGFHWITPFHNIAGMLAESASAQLATPLFIHPDQLRGGARGLPEYEAQTTFPDPWPGGWWRVRDIIDRQKVSAWALDDLAARNRETVLWNAYLKARRQTARGAAGKPAAYVIPAAQHDPLTMVKMVNKLLGQGLEIARARHEFTHEGRVYGAGTFIVPMAQPKMGVARWLLGRTFYPDNPYTRDTDGNPIRPYDMAADVMAEFMGVRVDPAETAVATDVATLTAEVKVAGTVAKGATTYRLDGRLNDSFRAVNMLLDRGATVRRVDTPADVDVRAGDFVVSGATDAVAGDVAARTGVDFAAYRGDASRGTHALRRLRIGMYQRYNGGNIDEGWTRFTLEQWDFPYTTLHDRDITAGNLASKYDVIILPADNVGAMTGEGGGRGGRGGPDARQYPPEYQSGFGAAGVEALRAFTQDGGTLVTFGEAGTLPIERFGLPLRNVVAGLPSTEFWCPGSTLHVHFDTANPLAYGMPDEGLATFLAGSQVYDILPTSDNERVSVIATYAGRDILQSGWLLGEQVIAKKAAMVSAAYGRGRVVLIGFRAQHRSQTHGTFKLVFNALMP